MSDELENEIPSPFDRFPGEAIEAAVVHRDKDATRVHGYHLTSDVARHYRWTEAMLLALTGELPSDENVGRALDAALTHLMDVTIADASVHAARIARHVASISKNDASVVATASVGLAEQARALLEQHAAFVDWLAGDRESAPPTTATPSSDRAAQLRAVASDARFDTLFTHPLGPEQAALGVLYECGLREPHQMLAAIVVARLPVAVAEAFAAPDPRLWKYPLNLPEWIYRPEQRDE